MNPDDVSYRPDRTPMVPPGAWELHSNDMTATFSADVTLAQAQSKLAQLQQWVPIDGDPALPLGHLVETNSTGPLRLGYGAWRDLLLGCQFTHGRGELITAGGRTVKNVAGYDLTKFMVGQCGVFGKIVTITTRTYRTPEGAIHCRFDPSSAAALVRELMPTSLRPQWMILTADALLAGYLGDTQTLDFYESTLGPSLARGDIVRRTLAEDITLRAQVFQRPPESACTFSASVPPSRIAEFIERCRPVKWAADPAFGIVLGHEGEDSASSRAREVAQELGGTAAYVREGRLEGPAFLPGPLQELARRLKKAFDPDDRLEKLELS